MSRVGKGFLVAGLAVLTLLVLAGAAVYAVIGTERGTAWALERVLPEEVAVERVEGRALGPLTLRGVDVRGEEGARTEVDFLHVEWRPRALLRRHVHVTDLEAAGVRYTAAEEEVEEEIEEVEDLPEVELPVGVEVERARISDVRIFEADGQETLTLEEISLRADMRESTVRVADLEVVAEDVRAGLRGTVELAGDYPLDVDLDWDARLPDQPPLAGAGSVRGSLADVQVEHRLEEPTAAHLDARVRDVVADLAWEAELDVPRFDLARLDEALESQEAGLTASASGSLEEVRGRASLAGSVAGIEGIQELEDLEGRGEVEVDVEGAYGEDRVTLDDLRVRMPEIGGRLAARGEVLLQEPLTVDVSGEWNDLAWPPVADPLAASPEGRFAVDGALDDYAFEAEVHVVGEEIPDGWWWFEGRGTDEEASGQVAAALLDGSLEADGGVRWDPEVSWNVALTGDDVDPEELHPEAAGSLSFQAVSDGRLLDDGLHADVILHRLEGQLLEERVEGTADLGVRGEAFELRNLRIEGLQSQVEAAGTLDEEWDLAASVDVPDLAVLQDLYEEMGGSVQLEAGLSGPRDSPRVEAMVELRNLAAFDAEVEELDLGVRVARLGLEESSVNLYAQGVSAPQATLGAVDLEARGTREDHAVALEAHGLEEGFLEVALAGGLEGEGWAGTLEALSVLDWTPQDLDMAVAALEEVEPAPGIGRWVLEAPVGIHASPSAAGLETACLRDGDRRVCLGGEWADGVGGDAHLAASELPLDAASPWLADFDLEGTLAADAEVALDGAGGVERFAGSVGTTPGALRYRLSEEEDFVVSREFRDLSARAEWADQVLDAEVALDFVEEGDGFQGSLRATGPDLPGAGTLEGRLSGSLGDRGLTGVLLPELDDSRGTLATDLRISGTVDEPRVVGEVSLADAGVRVIPAGIEIEDLGLELASEDGASWRLTGGARSGDGQVTLEGSLDLDVAAPPVAEQGSDGEAGDSEFRWNAEVAVEGEDFEAFNTSDARVVVTPELEARGDPDRVDLGGEVRVPEARITPGEMEGMVDASPDVRVVGLPDDVEEQPTPMDVHTEVRIVLGDEVHVDAFGLLGQLTGSLTVVDAPDREMLGRGELQVVDGEFTMYGQTLVVDRGRLIFADGPIDNPGLDIRVSREVDDILVGLDVAGTAERPEGEVFSQPAMAEADALSYLVLGRPLQMATEEEGDVLADAARTAGMAGAEQLAARLGEGVLGLEEVYIDPGEEGIEEAQLVVGAQITPSLHLGYALGLFEAGNILRVRYDLGRRWLIQTEAGEETGGDLFYTIER